MSFQPNLINGQVITNNELSSVFKCGTQSGMRYSRETKSLVLISDIVESLYHDRWIDGVFYYTGTGRVGDQTIASGPNRHLYDSNTNGVAVFLFERNKENSYKFIDQMVLAAEPYQETQPDDNKELRSVWVFPLKTLSGNPPPPLSEEEVVRRKEAVGRKLRKLSDEELALRAKRVAKSPGVRSTLTSTYERDDLVAEYAKRRANGVCQLCEQPAPFKNKAGDPYLESHHVIWLSQGGEDSILNTVALCPNCHRKMHVINDKKDVLNLQRKLNY